MSAVSAISSHVVFISLYVVYRYLICRFDYLEQKLCQDLIFHNFFYKKRDAL